MTIPDRFQEGVCKPKEIKILNGLFAEEMIDAEYCRLGEHREQDRVQLLCRCQVTTKRLFDDNARLSGIIALTNCLRNGAKKIRRNRQIVQRAVRRTESFVQ